MRGLDFWIVGRRGYQRIGRLKDNYERYSKRLGRSICPKLKRLSFLGNPVHSGGNG
jgi:hypothetical protein